MLYANPNLDNMQWNQPLWFLPFLMIQLIIINIIENIIKDKRNKQKIISYIGQSTLMILLLHKFPILFFQELCPIIKDLLNKDDTIINNIICIIISIVVIAMCMVCKYIIDIIRRKQYDRN